MKKLIIILLVVVCLASLWSCDNKNTNDQEPVETEPLSAFEQLNKDEQCLYEAMVTISSYFKSPSTVRLVDVGDMNSHTAIVKTQAYSVVGSPVMNTLKVWLTQSDWDSGNYYDILYSDDGVIWGNDKVSVKKINAAIDEYWKEKGLN